MQLFFYLANCYILKIAWQQRVLNGENEKCFSVTKFDRNTNSKEEEIPSPISVLEPTPIETESCSSSFLKPDSDLHGKSNLHYSFTFNNSL